MKNIPHDYYLRFLDPLVHDEVLDFHSKGNYVIHPDFHNSIHLHSLEEEQLKILTGNELILYPDMHIQLPMNSKNDIDPALTRNESETFFSGPDIAFETVEKLVMPITALKSNQQKRGYPSAGALYPIEVFVCSLAQDAGTGPVLRKFCTFYRSRRNLRSSWVPRISKTYELPFCLKEATLDLQA